MYFQLQQTMEDKNILVSWKSTNISLSNVWHFARNLIFCFYFLMGKADRFGEKFHFIKRKLNLKRTFV